MYLVVFQAVEIFVPFAAGVASIRLVLLHTKGALVWYQCLRVDD